MNNIKLLKINTSISLINQVIVILSGLILPRFILIYYGSEINGLVSSITQFLSIITFLELGVGGVVQATLYKPIAENNYLFLSKVLSSAKKYFRILSYILVIYIIVLIIVFPIIVDSPLDFISNSILIVAMSISLFCQYYFGLINQLLLNADQKTYVHTILQIITIILYTFISVVLIVNNFSIVLVRAMASLMFLIKPIVMSIYVKKKYMIETIAHTEDVLPQKWNGVAQHIAYTITNSTDIVVLTVFSTLENVSIYSVYNLVINGLKLLISSLTSSIQSFFGNLLAKEEYNTLGKFFSKIEWIIHTLVTNIFSITSVLITPFILIYTAGVQDVSYNVPVFGFLITMTQMLYCLRLPYYLLVNAAGQFKETQNGAIVEAIINVVISVLIVNKYGLIGVAIGTIIALGFRTIYLVIYLSNNILKRPATLFLKQIIVDLVTMCLIHLASLFVTVKSYDFFSWVYLAIIISCISLIISFIINYLFYNDRVLEIIKKIRK